MENQTQGKTTKDTKQQLPNPIYVKWIYQLSERIYIAMDYNDNLYKITGQRVIRIQEIYPTLWTIQNTKEQYYIDANIAKDDAEFINAFSEIAKTRGRTPEETFKQITEEIEEAINL